MTLCDVAGSSSGRSETAALCISSNKVCKVPGQFLHSISHAKGTGRREKKPHAALRQGRRQTGPPPAECEFQGSDGRGVSCALLVGGSRWIQKRLCLRQQRPAHLRPPRWKTLGTGRGQGAGPTRWACATEVCLQACCPLRAQAAAEPGKAQPHPRIGPPSGTSEGPRCSPGASWLDGGVLLESP